MSIFNPLTFKVTANYVLWRLGIRHVLPGKYIGDIAIEECHEPLVELFSSDRLLLDKRHGEHIRGRQSIVAALETAANALPVGYKLLIVEVFRSHETQTSRWNIKRQKIAAEHPQASEAEIDRLTSLVVANPTGNNVGGHQSGGAVDLTLADETGAELWMGSPIQKFTPLSPSHAKTGAEVAERRQILHTAMTGAGFVNYPAEWWHYSQGDQLWAAYTRQSTARFGPLYDV